MPATGQRNASHRENVGLQPAQDVLAKNPARGVSGETLRSGLFRSYRIGIQLRVACAGRHHLEVSRRSCGLCSRAAPAPSGWCCCSCGGAVWSGWGRAPLQAASVRGIGGISALRFSKCAPQIYPPAARDAGSRHWAAQRRICLILWGLKILWEAVKQPEKKSWRTGGSHKFDLIARKPKKFQLLNF